VRNPFRRKKTQPRHFVRLIHDDGSPPTLVGPIDRFVAEVFLINHLAHHPFHYKRRVVSARIIGEKE
jgi:hypothetical protein